LSILLPGVDGPRRLSIEASKPVVDRPKGLAGKKWLSVGSRRVCPWTRPRADSFNTLGVFNVL
jgi:hypothetical protein